MGIFNRLDRYWWKRSCRKCPCFIHCRTNYNNWKDFKQDVVGHNGAEYDQSIDNESDVHKELRIVKHVKKFKQQNRRGRKSKKGNDYGYLGEAGLDEGYEDIDNEMISLNGKLLGD